MKKLLGILAATAVFASLAATARAQTIVSLQYQTNSSTLIGTGTAGVVPVSNWNVATLPYVGPTGTYSLGSLIDSTGAITAFSEATYTFGGYDNGGTSGSAMTGSDANLFKGFAVGSYSGSGNLTLTLSGLNLAKKYELITYVGDAFGGSATLSGSVAGQTYFLNADKSLSTFTRGTATTAGAAASGNYFSFTEITGTSMTFTLAQASASGSALFGFQLIETVPEPSTCAMMLGGLGMLFAGQRMRRSRKS